jgi:hypothetical protein
MYQKTGTSFKDFWFKKINKYCFVLKNTINTYLRLEICVVRRESLAFKYAFIVVFGTKQMIIYIFTSEILKTHIYDRF